MIVGTMDYENVSMSHIKKYILCKHVYIYASNTLG